MALLVGDKIGEKNGRRIGSPNQGKIGGKMRRVISLGRYTCFVIIVLLVFSVQIGLASNGSEASPNVAIVGERISVRAMGVPLGELLEMIERETGIQFEVDEGILEEKIFVDLADVPFSEGIKKIFPSLNHAILYGASGKIRKVVLIGQGKASGMISIKKDDDSSRDSDRSSHSGGRVSQSEASPKGSEPEKPAVEGPPGAGSIKYQKPPGSDIPVMKGPPTEDVIKRNPPPGSDTTVIKRGPPTEDVIKQKPPPGSDVTVREGPPEGEPPPPMAPRDSGPPSGESKPPGKKGG
jgi:hypothetical protein